MKLLITRPNVTLRRSLYWRSVTRRQTPHRTCLTPHSSRCNSSLGASPHRGRLALPANGRAYLNGTGGRSPGKRNSFSEGPEQIVCAFAKGEAGNLRGKPKPVRAGTAERSRRARELPCSQAQQRRAERQTCLQTTPHSRVLSMALFSLP
jgi:hypothetical protein